MYEQVRSNKVFSYPHRRLGARLALGDVCLVTLLSAMGVAPPKEVPAMDITIKRMRDTSPFVNVGKTLAYHAFITQGP